MSFNVNTRYATFDQYKTQGTTYASQTSQNSYNIGEELSGNSAPAKMSRKEARAWKKEFRKANNCSRKEARQAYKDNFGVTSPHKEAKAWVKNYQEEFNCSRKDAKKAYEQTFGQKMPKGPVGKIARGAAVLSLAAIPGVGLPLMGLVAAEAIRENIAMKNKGDEAFTPINDFIMNGRFNLKNKSTQEAS